MTNDEAPHYRFEVVSLSTENFREILEPIFDALKLVWPDAVLVWSYEGGIPLDHLGRDGGDLFVWRDRSASLKNKPGKDMIRLLWASEYSKVVFVMSSKAKKYEPAKCILDTLQSLQAHKPDLKISPWATIR